MIPRRWRRAIEQRIRTLVNRCTIDLVDDEGGVQVVQLRALSGEVLRAEHFQPFGLTAVPLRGSEGVAFSLGGTRSHLVLLAPGHRTTRPTALSEGDALLYSSSDAEVGVFADGSVILQNSDCTIEMRPDPVIRLKNGAASLIEILPDRIRIKAPLVEFEQ